MRHNKKYNPSFGRHRGPRKALIRGLVHSLVEHERIKTTLSKAKTVRPLVEKAITMGKRGDVHSRRLLLSRYPNKTTVEKIIDDLAPRFQDRQGGYTRIIKLGFRSGDQAPLAYLEFVDYGIKITGGWVKNPKKPAPLEHDDKQQSFFDKEPLTGKTVDKTSPTDKKVSATDKQLAEKKSTEESPKLVDKKATADKKASVTDKKQADKKITKPKKKPADKKPLTEKKLKKQLLAQTDKKRKRARQSQKKSRRTNRS